MKEIPLLKAEDIECRVQQVTQKDTALVLLYKTARIDMAVLDQVFGPMNWECEYTEKKGNLFCTIRVWDEEKKCWISKEDVGVPSNQEAEKGEASDAFKRAGFKWGIGRELYETPTIFIPLRSDEVKPGRSGKKTTYERFFVSTINYDREKRKFTDLVIVDKNGEVRYQMGKYIKAPAPQQKQESAAKPQQAPRPGMITAQQFKELTKLCEQAGSDMREILKAYKVRKASELTEAQYLEIRQKQGALIRQTESQIFDEEIPF